MEVRESDFEQRPGHFRGVALPPQFGNNRITEIDLRLSFNEQVAEAAVSDQFAGRFQKADPTAEAVDLPVSKTLAETFADFFGGARAPMWTMTRGSCHVRKMKSKSSSRIRSDVKRSVEKFSMLSGMV
jgi:hypothetical protein